MKRPWIKNANNLLIVNTIFAALSGVLVVLMLQDTRSLSGSWWWELSLFVFSFFVFALTAERITDAVDDRSVQKYVAWMFPYNLGVISLFVGIGLLVHNRLPPSFGHWRAAVIALASLVVSWPWMYDGWWLVFEREKDFRVYLESLEGRLEPEIHRTLFMRLFYKIRELVQCLRGREDLPHYNVYTRLQKSPIHGVGVFAIVPIPKSTPLFVGDDNPISWVKKSDVAGVRGGLRRLYNDFAIFKGDWLGCPKNFNSLTPGWYLNHSKDPTVECREGYEFFARRDIAMGEELTIDYDTYSDPPDMGEETDHPKPTM